MAGQGGAQKFIGRNRPPRVQIECDEECYGAEVKLKLPFVAGVMADLSGKWEDPESVPKAHMTARGDLEDRKFLEISQDNFGSRMKAMKPTVEFTVPNELGGGGNLVVNLSFESMEDFSPDKLAEKLGPLKEIYEARQKLKNLKTHAGSKRDVAKVLQGAVTNVGKSEQPDK